VIIFDGFDEMADKVDRQKMINNFWELARVVCPGSKVILTSRTEHFPHDRESRQLLNAELESSTAKLKWESPRFELLELAKFNEAQIRRVLTLEAEEKGLSTDIVEKVMVRAELLDLARRPVMTELIIEAMPEIEAGKPVDMSRIYYYAIVRKMDRDIKAERTFTSLADKLYFLCEIAWEMLSTERMKLNYREFPDRIRQIFPQLVTEAKDLDHWHYDMMGQTILIRNADGDYTPAHRSLLEFLVAYKFAAEAGVLKADFVEAMQQQSNCIDGNAMPQDYTWTGYLQACVAAKCEGTKISPLRGFIPESSEYLRHTFGHEPLTKAVIDLIVPMLDPTKPKPLLDLIQSTKGRTEEETGWLGGNAATILVKKNTAALNSENLSHTQMANSDLLDANLQRVDFTQTNLTNSIFTSVLTSMVLAIATSQDGRFFATGHEDNNVRLWDTATGQMIHTNIGHKGWILAVAIAPDSQWLLSGSIDSTIKRWDASTGMCLQTYTGHQDVVSTVAIATDGNWFVSGSRDTLKRWDTITGKCIGTYYGHVITTVIRNAVTKEFPAAVNTVAIAPDGNWFVSGSDDNTLKRWDTTTGECLHTYIGHQDVVNTVAIAPDGNWFVSGSDDNTLKCWDTATGECLHTFTEHQGWVLTVAISSDGTWFSSGSIDHMLKKWDTSTKACLHTYSGHGNSVTAVAIAPDDKWLLSGSHDQTLKRWDTSTGKCLQTYAGYLKTKFTTVAISHDNTWLMTGSSDGTLRCLDTTTGKYLSVHSGHRYTVNAISIASDDMWFVSASNDNTLKRWNTDTRECLQIYRGHQDAVNTVAISSDDMWFVSGSDDNTLKRWDTATGECLQIYSGHQSSVRAVAISSDGMWFVSGSDDNTLNRWDTSTGECLNTYEGHQSLVRAVAISSDDSWFVSGSYDNKLKRWDIATGECIDTYTGHHSLDRTVAIASDDRWFVSGSDDYTLKRWNTKTRQCLDTYMGHKNEVNSVTISSDNCSVISCAGDEVKIWDVKTGECVLTISNQPYKGMRIGGAIGLTSGQIESLKALGAVDD
jgi:WD40 repeat protein